ncbi:hypothetical protein BGC_62230 [Burkholderia sp. 3C]
MAFKSTLDSIPAIPRLSGQLRKRPGKLHADEGHDLARCRRYLKQRGIQAHIARRGIESSERTHAWFAGFASSAGIDIDAAFLALTSQMTWTCISGP